MKWAGKSDRVTLFLVALSLCSAGCLSPIRFSETKGVVVDENGNGVEGVSVDVAYLETVYNPVDSASSVAIQRETTTTDRNGKFYFAVPRLNKRWGVKPFSKFIKTVKPGYCFDETTAAQLAFAAHPRRYDPTDVEYQGAWYESYAFSVTAALNALDADVRITMHRMAPLILPRLIANLKNPDQPTRAKAARTLGLMGSDATSVLPALEISAKDEDRAVQTSARQAIRIIQGLEKNDPYHYYE